MGDKMSFWGLILKNPFRNKTRTALAIMGISIGIATIIALGLVTDGLKLSTESTLKAGDADFTVTEANSMGFGASNIDQEKIENISQIEGVSNVVGVLMNAYPLDTGVFILMGINSENLGIAGVELLEGKAFATNSTNEVILGKKASETLDKRVGDTIDFYGEEFTVTGIYETGSLWEDGGAFMSLSTLQDLSNKDEKISMMFVKIQEQASLEEVTAQVDAKYSDELSTIKSVEEFNNVNKGLDTIDTATWAISVLAILIGGIGVINTMIMSVYERTREFGVLKALGWKDKRILTMIIGESLVITIIAALVGMVLGVVGVNLILMVPTVGGFIEPVYSLQLFLRGLGIALVVGVVGGIYPAYRATRLSPTEALRYE
jgi:putative ABC transport system permease protein